MNKIFFGDCRDSMRQMVADGVRAQMCVTSPPYFGLRDYGVAGQIGLEQTPDEYIAAMVEVFRCVRDVLADDGTLWLNIGDSYANAALSPRQSRAHLTGANDLNPARRLPPPDGCKPKDLIGIPWMLAFALRADGWYLRQDIIWNKPNPMPESVKDRCTKAHEYLFLLSKSERYFFNSKAIAEPISEVSLARISQANFHGQQGGEKDYGKTGVNANRSMRKTVENFAKNNDGTRNRRSVWTVATRPYKGAHFATFPPELITPCILAGSRRGDVVLDPFIGSGTTAAVAVQHGRKYLGCELNHDYEQLQTRRIEDAISGAANDNQPLLSRFVEALA